MDRINHAEGTCLCGNVTVSVNDIENSFGACHCDTCKTWTGGPQLAIGCGQNVEIKGEEHVALFDSSEWAQRAFCKTCGTHLFYKLKQTGDHRVLLGLVGKSISPNFDIQFFIDKKPECYSFAEETKTLTEDQVMELFASKV